MTSITTQTIYIIDDDEAVRDSLSMLLNAFDFSVEAYENAEEFLHAYNMEMQGCLILDIRMPGITGLELQEKLQQKSSHLPIIFITGHGDVPMAVTAMQRGAEEFLQKPFNDEVLIARIEQVLKKSAALSAQRQQKSDVEARLATLTKREYQVMQHLITGQTNKVIAAELNCSPRTIEIHRSRIMEKLAVRSVAELVALQA